MGSQASDRRMSFGEKEKSPPRWNDKRNDITVSMATKGPSQSPHEVVRTPREDLVSLFPAGAGRSRGAWRRGCLPNG